jgi:hypothetical protein
VPVEEEEESYDIRFEPKTKNIRLDYTVHAVIAVTAGSEIYTNRRNTFSL